MKLIKFYLFILPLFSLFSIYLGFLRSAYQSSYIEITLLISAIFDLIIILTARKYIINRTMLFVFVLLLLSLIVGLLNYNDLSRRYITDFTNPFFFFSKVFIFAAYWRKVDFSDYVSYYIKIGFWGSLLFLPIIYFLFETTGTSRLAIFPPMELPFSYYMQGNQIFMIVSVFIILLYGKRAQLLGAVLVYIIFVFYFKKKQLVYYLLGLLITYFLIIFLFDKFQDNLAVNRLRYTFETFLSNKERGNKFYDKIDSGRMDEIESVLNEMDSPLDYLFGKGNGYEYYHTQSEHKVANVHFSPLSFISKYGLFFTVFIYIFLLKLLFIKKSGSISRNYFTAFGTSLFIFIQSFFAYSTFAVQIYPVVLGYLMAYKISSNEKNIY